MTLKKPAPTKRPMEAKKPSAKASRKPASEPLEEEASQEAPWEGERQAVTLPPLSTDLDWVISEEVAERVQTMGPELVLREHVLLLSHARGMFLSLPPDKTMGMIKKQRADGRPGEGPKTAQLRKMVGG